MSATGGSATVAPLPGLAESVDVPLAGLTTLRVGGPARRLVTATTTHDVIDAVSACDRRGGPVLVLGGGSNLLVGDGGFDGTVVRIATRGVTEDDASACAGVTLRVAAGEPWDDLVALTVERGLAGVEALSGIPGCTGATPVQNVGAYGQEVADTILEADAVSRCGAGRRRFDAAECGFAYRDSVWKREERDRWVITAVAF